LIYVAKRNKRFDLFDLLSDELCHAIKASLNYDGYVVASVPRDKKRVKKYGFDHSECLAKAIAKKLGLNYEKILISKSKKAQKKTHGEERLKNAVFDYRKSLPNINGKKVLLVDDIVTTGASLGNSATLIKGLGAKSIVGVCIAVTYKDKYVPFKNNNAL
jgi:ComF family protein